MPDSRDKENPCPKCGASRVSIESACGTCGWCPADERSAAELDWYSRYGWQSSGAHVLYFILFPILNLAAVPALANGFSMYSGAIFFGVFLAEFELLVIWFTFSPKAVWVRWLTSVSVAALLYSLFLIGMVFEGLPARAFGDFARFFLLFPLIFVIMQLPSLFGKFVLGWRVMPWTDWSGEDIRSQFRIQHLMIGTGVVAASLSLARLAIVDNFGGRDIQVWGMLGIACIYTFVAASISLLPMLWGTLGAANGWVGGIVATGFVLGATLVVTVILLALFGGEASETIGLFMWLAIATATMMSLELGIARACGYRITRQRAAILSTLKR